MPLGEVRKNAIVDLSYFIQTPQCRHKNMQHYMQKENTTLVSRPVCYVFLL